MNNSNKAPKYMSFPLISILPQPVMNRVRELMEEDLAYQEQLAAIKSTREQIQSELAVICREHGLTTGLRYGNWAMYYGGMKTRRSLSKEALLINGVTTEQIEDSYVDSKPFLDLRIKDISKKSDDGYDY